MKGHFGGCLSNLLIQRIFEYSSSHLNTDPNFHIFCNLAATYTLAHWKEIKKKIYKLSSTMEEGKEFLQNQMKKKMHSKFVFKIHDYKIIS